MCGKVDDGRVRFASRSLLVEGRGSEREAQDSMRSNTLVRWCLFRLGGAFRANLVSLTASNLISKASFVELRGLPGMRKEDRERKNLRYSVSVSSARIFLSPPYSTTDSYSGFRIFRYGV